MDNFGEAVRAAREARGWSQERLADAVGTTQSTIDRIERGLVTRSRVAPEVAMVLDIPFHLKTGARTLAFAPDEQRATAAGASAGRTSEIPLYAAAEGGPGVLLISKDPIDFLKRPEPLEGIDDGYAVYVVGDSMVPEYEPADIALVHPRLPPVGGTTCIFYTNDGTDDRAMIKRLIRPRQDEWLVKQWNPEKEFELDRAEWPVCHRVVGRHVRR